MIESYKYGHNGEDCQTRWAVLEAWTKISEGEISQWESAQCNFSALREAERVMIENHKTNWSSDFLRSWSSIKIWRINAEAKR